MARPLDGAASRLRTTEPHARRENATHKQPCSDSDGHSRCPLLPTHATTPALNPSSTRDGCGKAEPQTTLFLSALHDAGRDATNAAALRAAAAVTADAVHTRSWWRLLQP